MKPSQQRCAQSQSTEAVFCARQELSFQKDSLLLSPAGLLFSLPTPCLSAFVCLSAQAMTATMATPREIVYVWPAKKIAKPCRRYGTTPQEPVSISAARFRAMLVRALSGTPSPSLRAWVAMLVLTSCTRIAGHAA